MACNRNKYSDMQLQQSGCYRYDTGPVGGRRQGAHPHPAEEAADKALSTNREQHVSRLWATPLPPQTLPSTLHSAHTYCQHGQSRYIRSAPAGPPVGRPRDAHLSPSP